MNRRVVERSFVADDDGPARHVNHYYLGWSLIETRDNFTGTGGPRLLSQYVWDNLAPGSGLYIDSLAEVAHNVNLPDTATPGDNTVDHRFYALQADAGGQQNVVGLIDANGKLIERYEYTLFGKRQVPTRRPALWPRCPVWSVAER